MERTTMIFLLDTHVLIWLIASDKQLGKQARKLADKGFAESNMMQKIVFLSVI